MSRPFYALLFVLFSLPVVAQMPAADGSIRYGNEWIDYERTYLAVRVAEDGLYRIPAAQLATAGITGTALELVHEGEQVPYRLVGNDVVFYGAKNRGRMDRFLFSDPDAEQLNDRYSMHTDTATYYLSAGPNGTPYTAAEATDGTDLALIQRRTERVFSDQYTKSFFRSSGASIYYSHYEVDGFGSLSSGDLLSEDDNTTTETVLTLPGGVAGEATLDIRYGTAFGGHNITVSADDTELGGSTNGGWNVHQLSLRFTASGQETTIRVAGSRTDNDKANLAWMAVTYPATPTYDERLKTFSLPASRTARSVTFTNLGAVAGAGEVVNAYAPGLGVYVSAPVDADGTATLTFPAAGVVTDYHLEGAALGTPVSTPKTFTPTLPTNVRTNYIILTSQRLNGPSLREMADYRRSVTGGSYVVTVVNTEDLYDEFGYGVPNHPMAIRNYLAAAEEATDDLRYLFIIGKGREFRDIRRTEDLAAARETFFVPSFGFPASDNLLTARIGSVVPQLAVGRLAAINDDEIDIYVQKLRDVEDQINRGEETIADRDWMKQVMHLGGGGTPGEQSSIKSRLGTMTDTIEASRMAAKVTAFFKTSTEPIEDSRQDAIFDRINSGVSILTFMGHSSSQTFDFSIDDPANYRNAGRYPFMLSLGCYSGDSFTEARSISERFIFLQDKGAVAFAASKGVGYISALGNWGRTLYKKLGDDHYGEGIGDALRSAIIQYRNTSNFTLAILLEQFALSGDPAYRLHPRPGADLVVDPASVSFEPEVVPAQDPTFKINFRLLNLGTKPEVDSVTLRFRQELPGGEVRELTSARFSAPNYAELTTLELPNVGFPAVGQNRILISVDVNDELTELPTPQAETNNELFSGGRAGVPLTVVANTARTAFPADYAVIGGELELVANTTNVLADARDYVIQVASDRQFSQMLSNETINSPGGIIRYTPNITPTDSTTYYWRISPDSSATEGAGFLWSESSFTWLADRAAADIGWALQHPGQTVMGDFTNIRADTSAFGWNFTKTVTDIRMINSYYRERNFPRFEFNSQRFGSPFRFHIFTGMQVIVIDTINNTTDYWTQNPGNGEYNTPPRSSTVWAFDTRSRPGREGFIRFMDERVPDGKYVFVYSVQRGNNLEYYNDGWEQDSAELGTTIFKVLEDEGALEFGGIKTLGSVPYLFAFQKGMGPISEVLAQEQSDTITMETTLFSNWPSGNWVSEPAGPALEWKSVTTTIDDRGFTERDSIIYRLMASNLQGEPVELQRAVYGQERTQTISLAAYSAADYPTMWVEFDFFDDELRTAPTVSSVFFDYAAPGDLAFNPTAALSIPDSIQQGQPFDLTIGYENISRIGMDSVLVELNMVNANNEVSTFRQRNAPLPAGAEGTVTMSIPTDETNSLFRYDLTLNPRQDQPEVIVFNNVLNSRTKVGQDVIAPTVQVFFDGTRINDGDLVSSKPEIRVIIDDENEYLRLNDTATVQMSITAPDGSTERISFQDSRVEFNAATTDDNVAEIFFRPEMVQDGIYTLELRGRDRSSNVSGRLDFRQEFEVINQQAVANVLAYPNPFTTSTRFVYTLTGNDIPDVFRIQIMTISGRVIRDIDLLAEEELKIGTHQTNFAWDGTDEYGDLLANGVYLYRVITGDSEGNALEKYDGNQNTDRFFARELGKVVIIR